MSTESPAKIQYSAKIDLTLTSKFMRWKVRSGITYGLSINHKPWTCFRLSTPIYLLVAVTRRKKTIMPDDIIIVYDAPVGLLFAGVSAVKGYALSDS